MKTVRDLFLYGKSLLSAAEIEAPDFDAKQLLFHLTGIPPGNIPQSEIIPAPDVAGEYTALLNRRASREPLQYILGEWEFYSLPLKIRRGVLIPRPETELLVDLALEALAGTASPEILDLCTGSGCIAAALAKNRPDARVTAGDFYDIPLKTAQENIRTLALTNAEVQKLDALAPPPPGTDSRFHLIACNPPYLTAAETDALEPEVKAEPREALCGGAGGLEFYRSLSNNWTKALRPGGIMIMEIGYGIAAEVVNIFKNSLTNIKIHRDLSSMDRIITGTKTERT